jgi:hypothetical protein
MLQHTAVQESSMGGMGMMNGMMGDDQQDMDIFQIDDHWQIIHPIFSRQVQFFRFIIANNK